MIKHFISSPVLSDLIDDFYNDYGKKCGAVVNHFTSNIFGAKIFGRANTLKLRKLMDGEDFHGIYKALDQYSSISENDVIVVENELDEFAYFGDLNARLSIRSGAIATIVDGATRDIESTKNLNYPVFAKSINAKDVRHRATVDYINKPIKIGGEIVRPKDLIFADDCSVVIIYKEFEDVVLEKAMAIALNEGNIIRDIWNDRDIQGILKDRGAF